MDVFVIRKKNIPAINAISVLGGDVKPVVGRTIAVLYIFRFILIHPKQMCQSSTFLPFMHFSRLIYQVLFFFLKYPVFSANHFGML